MSESIVAELESHLDATGQPKNPLRGHQRKAYAEERERLREIVTAPAYVTGADRGRANRRFRELDGMLQTQAPRQIDDATRHNAVNSLAKRVLDEVIVPALLPREIMRRNPTGAVDQFLKRENAKPVKHAIQTWKRAMFALDPTTDDRDHANLEKYRPELGTQGTTGFMTDAQIAGHFAFGPRAAANWPAAMPPQGTVNSALAQVQAREAKPSKKKVVWTPEMRKAASERMMAGRKAKQQASA